VVCHMNEGHAAFMPLARMSHLMKTQGMNLNTAMEIVSRTNVFTTHTPVPAGNEAFAVDLLRPHLEALTGELGISADQIIAWGQSPNRDNPYELSMTILGLRMAEHTNGVSQLHGVVERRMWANLWPGCPEDEIPIGHVTNGIHVASWLSAETAVLFDRYLGPEWRKKPSDPGVLADIAQIPDEELWRAHELGRARLIRVAREIYEKQMTVRNASRNEIAQAKSVLDYDVLTVGFARRFATYKRATLLMRDPDRLEAMLKNQDRPVQFIFAGKAHPADDSGKNFIRQIVHFAHRTGSRHRFMFLENYDMHIARYMVQGVDLWLNNPRRPHEASGTSGMKAAVNGVMHASVLDGWWCEGYSKECGWAIGHGEEYEDWEYQDTVESQAIYNMFENEIIPTFYDRPVSDVPTRWVAMMKASIKMALGSFSSHRMVSEYVSRFYQPAIESHLALTKDGGAMARAMVEKRKRLDSLWGKIKVELPMVDRDLSLLHIGDKFKVTTTIDHGELKPDELDVEVYFGPVNSENRIVESHIETMNAVEEKAPGIHVYSQEIACRSTGRYGFTARVRPSGSQFKGAIPGYVTWADGQLP
jgi:glycogen phosphorylase